MCFLCSFGSKAFFKKKKKIKIVVLRDRSDSGTQRQISSIVSFHRGLHPNLPRPRRGFRFCLSHIQLDCFNQAILNKNALLLKPCCCITDTVMWTLCVWPSVPSHVLSRLTGWTTLWTRSHNLDGFNKRNSCDNFKCNFLEFYFCPYHVSLIGILLLRTKLPDCVIIWKKKPNPLHCTDAAAGFDFGLTSQKGLICRRREGWLRPCQPLEARQQEERERKWNLCQGEEAKQKVEVTRSERSRTDRKRGRRGAGGGEERKGEEARTEEWKERGKSPGRRRERGGGFFFVFWGEM